MTTAQLRNPDDGEPQILPLYGYKPTQLINWHLSYECWQPDALDGDGIDHPDGPFNLILLIPYDDDNMTLVAVNRIDFDFN